MTADPPPVVPPPPSRADPGDDSFASRVAIASQSQGSLVGLWRKLSRPRREGAVPQEPSHCDQRSRLLLDQWFDVRSLGQVLQPVQLNVSPCWQAYRYLQEPISESWVPAFHGSWWYAIWSIARTGIVLASDSMDKGHEFWQPGVYCSPLFGTAKSYARPHVLFADGVYHRVLVELRVDPSRQLRSRERGGQQWVFPVEAVKIFAVWVQMNAPPETGEERLRDWVPELEAVPCGCEVPFVVTNLQQNISV